MYCIVVYYWEWNNYYYYYYAMLTGGLGGVTHHSTCGLDSPDSKLLCNGPMHTCLHYCQDKIHPLALKELRDTLAPILQVIFTESLQSGKLPDDWKTANVVPIYKKGSKHLPVNYRPVSLTCICSKVMEHIIVSQLCRHLEQHKILDKNQHGFRKGLSTETQLVDFVQELHAGTIHGR